MKQEKQEVREEDDLPAMELISKDEAEKPVESVENYINRVTMAMPPEANQVVPDETEELRKRAAERIARLRKLSFNLSDPNSDYEMVPAYMRRNMELHNQIANVESFYSNYTVKSNDENQAVIGTINSYLDGKKPD